MNTLTIVVVIVVLLVVVVRRVHGTPLVAADLFGGPVVLLAIGAYQLHHDVGLSRIEAAAGLWLAAALGVGFMFGAVRGVTVRLKTRDGALVQHYTVWTLLAWALSVGGSIGFGALAASAGMDPDIRPITLSMGVGLLGETLTLGIRALSTGLPFSTQQHRSQNGPTWVDHLVTAARSARPVEPPADGQLHHSPTLRDGIAWLTRTHD